MRVIRFLLLLLMIVGSLNWGLVGIFGYDLVSNIFGMGSMIARSIFTLVGVAGLLSIPSLFRCYCCNCKCGPDCNCHKQ